MSQKRLEGQVAVITGGATGIGKAIATRLASEGATPVIADLNLEQAQSTALALNGLAVQTDVTSSASVNALSAQVLAVFGRVDVVVNNAGIHIQKLAIHLTDEDWDSIQSTNARGCFFVCRAFAPHLMRQEAGRIINIITKITGNPYSSAYVASKSAVLAFTQCLALELAPYHVTVNAVAPGHVGPGTGMEKWFRAKAELIGQPWEEFEQAVLKGIPLGRWCTPEDVAGAVAYLASDDAHFITAETISVTGGWSGYASTPKKEPQ
jgi:NAD(P)-dependent dehydrogenase (short-subunit alcohol dehydrogenase family)